MSAYTDLKQPAVREVHIPVENAELYARETGRGEPVIVLHGGPDFSHSYFLPELDRLSNFLRLIYYDQRGRGRSSFSVQPEDVSLESEIQDLEAVREYFGLESITLMGHSWGGLLALEYAVRQPQRVSHLILLNTAPVSHSDFQLLRQQRLNTVADDMELLKEISSTARYKEGDPDADADYYRIHFRLAIRPPEQLEKVVTSLRLGFTNDDIVKAREIELRLYGETWFKGDYNLLPELEKLNIPTLVIHGDYDIIPMECAAHIAQAISGARLVILKDTGHFSFLESPDAVSKEIYDFFGLFKKP